MSRAAIFGSPLRVLLLATSVAACVACGSNPQPEQGATPAPGAAAEPTPVAQAGELLANGGFEEGEPTSFRPWEGVAHATGEHYSTLKGTEFARSGQYGAELRQLSDEAWGAFSQFLAAVDMPADTPYRFSTALRGSDIHEAVTLNVAVVSAGREPTYYERRLEADEFGDDWIERSVDIVLPAGRSQVEVAITLKGAGHVWIDDASLAPLEPAAR
jgi:hypothetical protein